MIKSKPISPPTPGLTGLRPAAGARACARTPHPLLGVFPLATMTVAAVVLAFTLAMAELNGGTDPSLRADSSSGLSNQPLTQTR